ncbi:ArsR/SmtB family transcription factor [Actinomadura litoris]|uniref:ArsR/SmtB family transcription factor n=1 Tax=Actinomadura litoris TaxID=2678616 RepID=UPI001FA808CE|nr:helix-turn-helix domain-containing protein [Actinomadura litoris]
MLRLKVNIDDVARMRFARAPAPLMEVYAGVRAWKATRRAGRVGAGARRAIDRFPSSARPLLDLIPSTGPGPAFVAPIEPDLPAALGDVRDALARGAARELEPVLRDGRDSEWLRALTAGRPGAADRLVRALESCFVACLLPHWSGVLSAFDAEAARFGETLLHHGAASAIDRLSPLVRWRGGAVEVRGAADAEITPGGGGLVLLPLAFWDGDPLVRGLSDGTVLVAYAVPETRPKPSARVGGDDEDALAGLVGQTRAGILRALPEPCGTSELAVRIGMSVSVTSEHAKILRRAGLITSVRHGRHVRHALTSLGRTIAAP